MDTILVVDDNPASRELVRAILKGSGAQVLEACDGEEALRIVALACPDLVLLDLDLPGLDGFAVLRRLRQDPQFQGLSVVAVTAYAMQGDREKVLAAGFDGYISKPVHPSALREQIGRFRKREASNER